MFAGFDELGIDVGGGVRLRVRHGGDGPPVVLLHGHPRTHTTWYRVAPLLVDAGHTVVCTHDGLAAAKARGRKGGPKFKMTPNKIAQARAMYDGGQHTVQEIADTFGVSRPTVYRHLTDRGAAAGAEPA